MGIGAIFKRQKSQKTKVEKSKTKPDELSQQKISRTKSIKSIYSFRAKSHLNSASSSKSSETDRDHIESQNNPPLLQISDDFISDTSLPDFGFSSRSDSKNISEKGYKSKLDPRGAVNEYNDIFDFGKPSNDRRWDLLGSKGSQESSNLSSTETSVYQDLNIQNNKYALGTRNNNRSGDGGLRSGTNGRRSFLLDTLDDNGPSLTVDSIFNFYAEESKDYKDASATKSSDLYFDSSIIDWDNKGLSETYYNPNGFNPENTRLDKLDDEFTEGYSKSKKNRNAKTLSVGSSDLLSKKISHDLQNNHRGKTHLKNSKSEFTMNVNKENEPVINKAAKKRSLFFGLVGKSSSKKTYPQSISSEKHEENPKPSEVSVKITSNDPKKAEPISYANDESEDESLPLDMRRNKKFSAELKRLAEEEEIRLAKELEKVKIIRKKENEEKKRNKVYDRMRERHLREYKINNIGESYKPAYPTAQDENDMYNIDTGYNQKNGYVSSEIDTPASYTHQNAFNGFGPNGAIYENQAIYSTNNLNAQLANVNTNISNSGSIEPSIAGSVANSNASSQANNSLGENNLDNEESYYSETSSDEEESIFKLNQKILKKIAEKELKYINSENKPELFTKINKLRKLKEQHTLLENSIKKPTSNKSDGSIRTGIEPRAITELKNEDRKMTLNRKRVRFNHTVSVVFDSPLSPFYPNKRMSNYESFFDLPKISKPQDDLDFYMSSLKNETATTKIKASQSLIDLNTLNETGRVQLLEKVAEIKMICKHFSKIKSDNLALSPNIAPISELKGDQERFSSLERPAQMSPEMVEISNTLSGVFKKEKKSNRNRRVERVLLKQNDNELLQSGSEPSSGNSMNVAPELLYGKGIHIEERYDSLGPRNTLVNTSSPEALLGANIPRRDNDVAPQFNHGFTSIPQAQTSFSNQVYNYQANFSGYPQISNQGIKYGSFNQSQVNTPMQFYNMINNNNYQNKPLASQANTPSLGNFKSISQRNLLMTQTGSNQLTNDVNTNFSNTQQSSRTVGYKNSFTPQNLRHSVSIPTLSRMGNQQALQMASQNQTKMYHNSQTPKFQHMQVPYQQIQTPNLNNVMSIPGFQAGYNPQNIYHSPNYNPNDSSGSFTNYGTVKPLNTANRKR
ncbi:hypothetical protein AYI70_g9520 [Smittium culicis]|uniref:Uncharacterized protein n=1 Tax=Smittium culicis TaxID=133412 RepID=A0A1R1XAS7_9FUNG|nr:hypothetical protein AYI70_g9520 [Smittium culicis]